ncbi:class II aldolase/adducin family protein [Halarcobacter sp.]|uniref:class II aldolase/adducin family protein n=1 Tax=Halarcobacter sp. TaxID=2321133 RepID=UPI002AA8C5A3|nr:class II aldolase/adducin family protein [Halarcobacter sp.]
MNEVEALVRISKFAGERFDLVQAGGGNSSVKLDDDRMLIKASGFSLSEVEQDSGYSKVSTSMIAKIVENNEVLDANDKRTRESITANLVKEGTIDKENRPSIETLLHSLVYKYTLHTHPVVVNMVLNKPNYKEILSSLFDSDIVLVEYKTPGIELALELYEEINKFEVLPKLIFLQNHGLIVTSNELEDIENLTNEVVDKISKYLQMDMTKYKKTNKISKLLKQLDENENITYLSNDLELNSLLKTDKSLFFKKPFCPDSLVYCGISGIEIKSFDDIESINEYQKNYYELPKVIIHDNDIFLSAKNIKKAKDMEDVLKFHILVLAQDIKDVNYLELDELAYLSNWEAEKYRQKL